MKKILLLLAALLLAATLVCCTAAGEPDEEEDDYSAGHPDSRVYQSEWAGGSFRAEIYGEDAGLSVMIYQEETWPKGICWEYTCLYDEATGTLTSTGKGSKSSITFDEDGMGGFTFNKRLYSNGRATFAINENGCMVWNDEKDDAGKGIEFQKIGWYDRTFWISDRAAIDILWQKDHYRVTIEWAISASESSEWTYRCAYDAEDDCLTGTGVRTEVTYDDSGEIISSREAYSDGAATFLIDEEGCLIWQDQKENAGENLAFEQIYDYE